LTLEIENGGHIAYGIRPSERKKGYGKQQLLLILDVARNMNIPKVMIVCDKDNIASAKTAYKITIHIVNIRRKGDKNEAGHNDFPRK
jgi:predicted acetyltransferase